MNMAELSLYNPDGEDDEISAEITAGYDVMYEKLRIVMNQKANSSLKYAE